MIQAMLHRESSPEILLSVPQLILWVQKQNSPPERPSVCLVKHTSALPPPRVLLMPRVQARRWG